MTRRRWLIAVTIAIELGVLLTHPAQARAVLQRVYDFCAPGQSLDARTRAHSPTNRAVSDALRSRAAAPPPP